MFSLFHIFVFRSHNQYHFEITVIILAVSQVTVAYSARNVIAAIADYVQLSVWTISSYLLQTDAGFKVPLLFHPISQMSEVVLFLVVVIEDLALS